MSPDLLEAARALRDEVRELRSAVRENTRHITRGSSTDRSICGRRIPPGSDAAGTMRGEQCPFPWNLGERHVSAITRHVSDHTGP